MPTLEKSNLEDAFACRKTPKYASFDFNKDLTRFPQSASGVYVIQYECSTCPSEGSIGAAGLCGACSVGPISVGRGVDMSECRTSEHTVKPSGGLVG